MGEKSVMSDELTFGGTLIHADREPDFSGYVTKYGLKCSDGRTITNDAFKHQDGMTVPLVWQHNHDDPKNVLGHVLLEGREDGMYGHAFLNDTENAKHAQQLVIHDDINSLSIYANKLLEKASSVLHGVIREVSLVMAGANPGALIDNIAVQHSDGGIVELDDEAIIYTGEHLVHGDEDPSSKPKLEDLVHSEDDPTVQEVYDSMTTEQKNVVNYMVGAALEANKAAEHSAAGGGDPNNKEGRRMSRNVFEQQNGSKPEEKHTLSHDDVREIVADAKRVGSFKDAVQDYALKHGIENIDILFPDARTVMNTPEFDKRRTEWVSGVINGTKHSPFSRIKSLVADITHDEARAKGYIKGSLKKEEFFSLTKRVTTPATVYKKQKLDRDDIIDITDFDVVIWLKAEMRLMLDEEIARAILIGDGREIDDEDKIKDPMGATEGAGIRSIRHDHDLYAAQITVDLNGDYSGTELADTILTNMRFYKGSGSPTFYTTLPVLTKMLLARDGENRRYWRTASDLAAELGVSNIVTVEVMEEETDLIGIIVNLSDYTVGADKGGEVSFFDDFDIDYNQYKYLIETRISGALTKIRSALVILEAAGDATLAVPVSPAFDAETGTITPATTTGVTYKRADTNATVTTGSPITLSAGESLKIYAIPASGSYYFENNVEDEWTFEFEG